MIPEKKMREYIERIEKCIPEILRYIHISAPKDLTELKLTLSQVVSLASLGYKDSRKMSELAESVSMNMSAMTGIVDRLIKIGLVERMRSRKDRRAVIVKLTPKGRKIVKKIQEHRYRETQEIIEYLDEKEREDFIKGFEKVVEAFTRRSKERT